MRRSTRGFQECAGCNGFLHRYQRVSGLFVVIFGRDRGRRLYRPFTPVAASFRFVCEVVEVAGADEAFQVCRRLLSRPFTPVTDLLFC